MNQTGLKVKGIFLDLDGTIVDSTDAYMEAARVAFHTIGQKPPERKTALEIPRRLSKVFNYRKSLMANTKKFLSVYFQTYYSGQPRKNQAHTKRFSDT